MRRRLVVTTAAVVAMVLLAMLIPMAVLVRSYAQEDRISRAALEVQATETVVSGQDKGAVAKYIDLINASGSEVQTTVLYPTGVAIGPSPGEDDRVREARTTGQARIDDTDRGAEILVPVSVDEKSGQHPVIRVEVIEPVLEPRVLRAWLVLAALGLALLAGALVMADRFGRWLVQPISELADHARRLGEPGQPKDLDVSGPVELRELGDALNRLVERIDVLLERERRSVADLSHRLRTPITALRLRLDMLADEPGGQLDRISEDLDELEAMVDHVVREARRSEREGLVAGTDGLAPILERVRFWVPLAEDQGRELHIEAPPDPLPLVPVRASAADLVALVDVLMDNAFVHAPDDAAIEVRLSPRTAGGLRVIVDDAGPGFPVGLDVESRGTSGGGSTGLGLAIVSRTATESGGGLELTQSPLGGARVAVDLGGL